MHIVDGTSSATEPSPVKQTPPKTVISKDYDPTTGWTPIAGAKTVCAEIYCDRMIYSPLWKVNLP